MQFAQKSGANVEPPPNLAVQGGVGLWPLCPSLAPWPNIRKGSTAVNSTVECEWLGMAAGGALRGARDLHAYDSSRAARRIAGEDPGE